MSFVRRADRAVVRRFVKPVTAVEVDGEGRAVTLQGEPVDEVAGGLPVLAGAAAWLACAVRQRHPLGSHDLYVGEIVDVGGMEDVGGTEDVGSAGGAGGVESVGGTEGAGGSPEILRMEDTRMNYGG